MRTSDWISAFVTLIGTGVGYFISGPKAAAACIIVGTLGATALHFASKGKGHADAPSLGVRDSFNPVQKQEFSPTFSPTIVLQTAPPASSASLLPSVMPRVHATDYGASPKDRDYGLFIVNDGGVAFDLSIENAAIGSSTLEFWGTIPRLAKDDGQKLYRASIKQSDGTNLLGNGLFKEMIRQGVNYIVLKINFKDADNVLYVSTIKIERDVLAPGGLAVRFVSQTVAPPPSSGIDGELYRLVTVPRTAAWEILRDAQRIAGKEPSVDCDVLIEMYLVNRTAREKYIRELRLSAEIGNKQTNLVMQKDLRAQEINRSKWEFALDKGPDFYAPETPMRLLLPEIPFHMLPEQSIEGWVRFRADDINPDNINPNSWRCIAVDSLGAEYPITKIGSGGEGGRVTLRQIRS